MKDRIPVAVRHGTFRDKPIERLMSTRSAFSVVRIATTLWLAGASTTLPGVTRAQTTTAGTVPGQIVEAFDTMFKGPHAGMRAVHSNGLLYEGVFTPAATALTVTTAEHLTGSTVPLLVRFSNFAGVPGLPDGDPAASPRGMAIKFLLSDEESTDIVAHSYNGFPAATPEEFLAFLKAAPNPVELDKFASIHPAARKFLDDPKPTPSSYGMEAYFGVTALRFTNTAGTSVVGRYHIVPTAGVSYLNSEEAAARKPEFLLESMQAQLARGPVTFRFELQLANTGDPTNDGSVVWPSSRPTVELGTIRIASLVPAEDPRRTKLTFVPTNIVDGISLTDDPMLLARTQAYRISYRRRHDAR